MIAIIKYKAGNIASVSNALDRLGAYYFFAETPQELESARAVIFPGVGHAASAMESLKELGVDTWLKQTTKPVLGICVGMQLLYEGSTEGNTEGLGIIPGKLQKFDSTVDKVPHMGWNNVERNSDHHLMKGIDENKHLYFVHSYYAPLTEHAIASCNYINPFTAAVVKDNFMGVQFHPEKSGNVGSMVLQNFLDLVYSNEKVQTKSI
ncbi:imidazole glycerol phosphate synthase subunit HisH [Balneola vulgaris]|uniref:imidazole glycerol phosphate synthase subunit HisH n=1 Tax=Balneola vulgaris TaxID=287535 RepID=UPI00036F3F9D|nr:imidazole glycerol phosphate synthase subunit HisH [Balneola vulgaris]